MSLKKSVLLVLLVVLFSVPALWYTVIFPYRVAESFFQQAPTYFQTIINETYPHDLEVTVTNGVVSLNRPTPYCLTLDKQSYKGILFDPNFTTDMYKPELLSSYPLCTPLFVVGDTTVIYPENNPSGFNISKISPTVNIILNKTYIDSTTKNLLPVIIQWGWILYLAAPILLIPFTFLFVLLWNVWYAFVNKIIFSLIDNEEHSSFLKSYALSLRFFTILIIMCSGMMVYNFYSDTPLSISFPFLNTIIIAISSTLWTKKYATITLDTTTSKQSSDIESHALPSPQTNEVTGVTISDSSTNSSYTFDPSVISTPTDVKPSADEH